MKEKQDTGGTVTKINPGKRKRELFILENFRGVVRESPVSHGRLPSRVPISFRLLPEHGFQSPLILQIELSLEVHVVDVGEEVVDFIWQLFTGIDVGVVLGRCVRVDIGFGLHG